MYINIYIYIYIYIPRWMKRMSTQSLTGSTHNQFKLGRSGPGRVAQDGAPTLGRHGHKYVILTIARVKNCVLHKQNLNIVMIHGGEGEEGERVGRWRTGHDSCDNYSKIATGNVVLQGVAIGQPTHNAWPLGLRVETVRCSPSIRQGFDPTHDDMGGETVKERKHRLEINICKRERV